MFLYYLPVVLLYLIPALAAGGIAWYAWKHRGIPGLGAMPLLSLGIIAWAIGNTAVRLTPQPPPNLFFLWLIGLGIDILPIASLAFVIEVVRSRTTLTRLAWGLLLAGLLVGQFFFWISLQSQASLPGDSTSYTSHFWLSSTTWGWFHVVVNLGLLVAAGLFFLSRLAVAPRLYLTRTRILMVGTISAWVIYLIEIANLKPIPYPDLTPLLFTTWQLILLTYSFNVRLHEILPLARDALIGKMGDAILVLDTQGRIIDLNQAAQQLQTHLLQDQPDQPLAGQLLERLFPVTKQWFAGGSAPPAAPLEISVDEGAVARNFELRVSPLKDALGGLAGYLMICQDTTARKHGEDQRQELSARLEQQVRLLDATLATSSDYFLLLDHQGRLLYASPLALDALGLSIDQASGKTWRKLDLPTEAGEMLDEHMASVYETGKKAATELHYFSKKGAKHFNLTISPILDAQGQVSQVICTFHDIRTRRELEGALRASEDRFQGVIDNLQEGVVIQNADGRVIACNSNAERLLGLSVDRTLDRIFVDTSRLSIREDGTPFPSESQPPMMALRTGRPQSNIVMGIQKQGRDLTWVLINSQPMITPGEEQPNAVVSSYVDITQNKNSEKALQESQKKIQALLESTPNLIVITNREGSIQLANKKTEEALGYGHDELIGQHVEILIPEQQRSDHPRLRQEFIASPRPRQMGVGQEVFARRKDGVAFPVEVTLNTIETDQGLLVVSQLVDTSNRKQNEEALQQSQKQLALSLNEQESYNRELRLLSEMGEMLQSCATSEDAYAVVAEFARHLFPDSSGALYLINHERDLMEAAATWGDVLPTEPPFAPHTCWALRRGRVHTVHQPGNGLSCQHIHDQKLESTNAYICVPMQSQSEVIGVFHLRFHTSLLHPILERWVATVAEYIAISLANISLRDSLRIQSVRDMVTGLYNRRYLGDALRREIHLANRYDRPLSMLMLDIDHFKDFNDTFGHTAGDALLRAIGAFMKKNLRAEDIPCRYGGEEFTVILPDTPLKNSRTVAEKLWRGLRSLQVDYLGKPLGTITVSVGSTGYLGDSQTNEQFLEAAEKALFQAKQQGRDQVFVAETDSP